MAAHYYSITRDEIDEHLSGLGFVPLKLHGVVELVYGRIIRIAGHHLSLRCYTAINPNGESREKGTDAIRLQLFMRVEDGIVPVGRPQKCLRVESWRENVRKAIERAADPNNFRICPACGSPQVVRQNRSSGDEFWGCSLFKFTGCRGKRSPERTPPVSSNSEEPARWESKPVSSETE